MMPGKTHRLAIMTLISCLLIPLAEQAAATERLQIGVASSLSNTAALRTVEKFLDALAAEMAVSIEMVPLPPKRALKMLQSGEIHADLARIACEVADGEELSPEELAERIRQS